MGLLVVLAMLLAACPASAPEEAAAPAPAEGGMLRIAFSVPSFGFPFFASTWTSGSRRAAALGNVEIISLDGQDRTEKQVADLESVIAQETDGDRQPAYHRGRGRSDPGRHRCPESRW
ncbi:MAG: hypothetical protein R2851_16720 [Caldilineaceae bacterium]